MAKNDKTKALYDALHTKYNNLGTYEEFANKLDDEGKRKAFYDHVSREYKLGTWEEFSAKVAPAATPTAQPPAQPQAAAAGGEAAPAASPADTAAGALVGPAAPAGWQPTEQERIGMAYELDRARNASKQWFDGRAKQTARAFEPYTNEGREKLKAKQFEAQMAGADTKLMGIAPPVSAAQGGAETQEGGKEYTAPQVQSPVPYGVEYVDGKAVTKWLLPDGSVTTNRFEADQAEYVARQGRLRREFETRMAQNGLDPTKQEDVQKQALVDAIHSGYGIDQGQRASFVGWLEDNGLDAGNMEHILWAVNGDTEKMLQYRLGVAEEHLKTLMAQRQAEKDEANDGKPWYMRLGRAFSQGSQNMHPTPSGSQAGTAESDIDAAVRTAQAEVAQIDKALRDYRNGNKAAGKNWFGQTWQGLLDGITDPNTWTAGVHDSSINDAVGRADTATDEGRRLVDAYGLRQALAAETPPTSGWYGGGHFAGEMLADPVTYIAFGVGGGASKAASKGIRMAATKAIEKKVAEKAAVRFAERQVGNRILSGMAGSGANLFTFEFLRDTRQQAIDGGWTDSNGELQEGFSWAHALRQGGHGFMLGTAMGLFGEGFGNVGNHLVRHVGAPMGKVGVRAGQHALAFGSEASIFAMPEIIEFHTMGDEEFDRLYADRFGYADETDETKRNQARDKARNSLSWDAWGQSAAMVASMKMAGVVTHAPSKVEHASQVIEGLRGKGAREHLSFGERVSRMMDGSPFDIGLTNEELDELKRGGYESLADFFVKRKTENGEMDGEALAVEEVLPDPNLDGYDAMQRLMADGRISQSTRAKMYFMLTGHMLPMGTVTGYDIVEAEGGGVIVNSMASNGEIVTTRRFGSREEAQPEIDAINRQAELNTVDIGEAYAEARAEDAVLDAAIAEVLAEENIPTAQIDAYKRAYIDMKLGGKLTEEQTRLVEQIDKAIERNKDAGDAQRPETIRREINEKHGVDIDEALRKRKDRRTDEEQAAIDEYMRELIPRDGGTAEYAASAGKLPADGSVDGERQQAGFAGDEDAAPRHDAQYKAQYDEGYNDVAEIVRKYGAEHGAEETAAWLEGQIEKCKAWRDNGNDNPTVHGQLAALEDGLAQLRGGGADQAEAKPIGRAVMKVEDRPVEVMSGRVEVFEDGTIDRGRSEETIVIRDPATGKVEMVSPEAMLSYEGMPAEAPTPIDKPAEMPQGSKYGEGRMTIKDEDGVERLAWLTGEVDEDGKLEYYVDGDLTRLRYSTEEELDKMVTSYTPKPKPAEAPVAAPADKPATEEDMPATPIDKPAAETPSPAADAVAPAAVEPAPSPAPAEAPAPAEPTALERLPRDAKGEPAFERADSPEHGWDALVEFAEGDKAFAKQMADNMAEEKRKALDNVQKQKVKGKTPTEMLASKKANEQAVAQAQAEYDAWRGIAAVEQNRENARLAAEEAESRRLAAEMAEREKAEREAAEEAARLEREALEGIPEWHNDTPENARKRGARRYGGQLYTRQEPIEAHQGKEVEVKFSRNDLPKGRVALVEADQLQPSHLQGQANPMHFIDEAQPKNRAEEVSAEAARNIAENLRPEEITGSATAYTGAPTVNARGEVIQGNGRSDALRYLWDNALPEQQEAYRQYLIDNADRLGLDPEQIKAMRKPVLVNMLDVTDTEAIRLGQLTAQDTESGGIERIKPKNVAQTLGDGMRTLANMLLQSGDEEATFGQLVDRNGADALRWLNERGAISNTQYQSAFDSKGNLTAEAKNDLQKVLYQAIFKGGSKQLEEMFDALPAKAQRALLATAYRDMDSPLAGKMLPELQASIAAYNELMHDPDFAKAKNLEQALRAVEAYKLATALDDRFESVVPAEKFSNFALHLAALYKASDVSQTKLASLFNQMYDLAQGKTAATLFEEADPTKYSLGEVVKKVLGIEYKQAKNGTNDRTGSTALGVSDKPGQAGRRGDGELSPRRERAEGGTEPAKRGGRAQGDGGAQAVKGASTVQAAVDAASAQVNIEPTPAQAEAGNYKKGHVKIAGFDITIENPAGGVRRGVDADGKEWSTTMANAYGYIKGTEGVDGDHIDVFLHENMDTWDGRKVFVVDQPNTDGSFDEHKVMLGFNNKEEAMKAYLANYDKSWADTHPGLRISETSIEDFNKWVQSSHRKTKPFADYSSVSKVVDEVRGTPADKPAVKDPLHDEVKEWLSSKGLKAEESSRNAVMRNFGIGYMRAGRMLETIAKEGEQTHGDKPAPAPEDKRLAQEAPKPKKRRWISDEDAQEFDKLRNGLRDHLGQPGDMVSEPAAEYGGQQPQTKPMDAEVLRLGTRMTYLMMKGGLRKFADYVEAMVDEVGDGIRPHLKSLYAAAQNMEEVMRLGWDEEMDDRRTVKAFDVYNFDKPGAKDIVATAQHVVDETASQEQADKIIQTIKDERNEQRRKEDDKTAAGTEAVASKAESVASQAESELEAARTERAVERQVSRLDKELEEVNKQLALLGYYEADEVDKDFNEAYGYMRNAERKATQDAHRLATQLAADLGIEIDPKDKVRKAMHTFGSKIAQSDVAPAGGEVIITLPLANGLELKIWVGLDKNEKRREGYREDRISDDLMVTSIMYRVEDPNGEERYVTSNHNIKADATYDELLAAVRRLVRGYLPDEQVKPAEPLVPKPGEDYVGMAKRVADDAAKKRGVEPEQTLGDLFGGKHQVYDRTTPTTPEEQRSAISKIIGIAKRLKDRVERAVIGGITQRQKQDLSKVGVEIDESWVHSFETSAVIHNQKHHGNEAAEAKRNQTAITPEDYNRIPDILENYDKVSKSANKAKGTNNEVIVYEKEFEDGYVYYLEEKRDSRKSLAFHTMYKKKKGADSSDGFAVDTTAPITPLAPSDNLDSFSAGKGTKKIINDQKNEKTELQPGTEKGGRGRQQPRPDEPLGAGARHEDERTDGGGVARRGGEHSVSDAKRGSGVSGRPNGERGVTGANQRQTGGTNNEPRNNRNNHAERGVDYAPKGEKARIEANLAAIELAKRLLETGAQATPEEMAVLRRFSGWGGLGSAFNEGSRWAPNPINQRLRQALTPEEYEAAVMSRNSAYYTPATVIDTMWDIVKSLGFKGGNILEGSAGIGNIIGLMPTDISGRSSIHAVEIDGVTGGILRLLYPDAKVDVQGFEKTRIANGSVDLAITNVPFVTGLRVTDEVGDGDLSKKFRDIHDFCIAKNVRKLREGGIGIFITSSGTLDKSQALRNWLVGEKEGNADVVGVFRMHNQTFGGTAATSDIIVVRKRVNGRRSANAVDVSTVTPVRTAAFTDKDGKTKDVTLLVNRHFVDHPEHMGGEMYFGFEQGDSYRPTAASLYPSRTADQAARMEAWARSLAEKDWSKEQGGNAATAEQAPQINEALGDGVKEGSMVVDSEGNLCLAREGKAVPLDVNKNKIKGRTKEECLNDFNEVKRALAEVLKYQTEHDDDAGLQPLLDILNKAYDTFVERYGHFNKNSSLAWLRNDVDFPSIAALESYSERGGKDGTKEQVYGKTDIFSRRVVKKESEPSPKNVKDGIIASLYKYGRIDTEYMAEQLGKDKAEVKREIIESGLGFENPTTGQMEVSYEYLSGNVREKLRQAREANEASGGAYAANVKALEAVVPMNIPAHLIEFSLGSSWIEPGLYERYIKERTDLDVKLTNVDGTWFIKEPWSTDRDKNTAMGVRSEAFGTLIPGHKLIEAALTNRTITVSKTIKDGDGRSHTETDRAATTACAAKVDEIRQDFKDWAREQMQNDPDMSQRIEDVYNEKFNNSVPKSIPDEFVPERFGGAATVVNGKPFKLRTHQAKAVVRATTEPVMLAHEVGTGKTYTLITTAMEMRRLGTARKPMAVVQNATVGQFVASAKALYPNAKILTIEDVDTKEEGRKAFYAKIKYNDWDMVVIPQSVLDRIPDSVERQVRYIQGKIEEKMLVLEQMKNADPLGKKNPIVGAAEREIARLENDLAQLANGSEPTTAKKGKKRDAKKEAVTRQNAEVKAKEMLDRETDEVDDFDSLGIDAILVDEAHEYKHLGFATAMQRGVKGVDSSYSKKSQGLFLKTQAVLEKTGGKNVVFATGTPISNTAAEIWTFMRYLMPAETMKDYGIYYFDDFVRNFGNLQQMLEFKTNGKFAEVNRFAGYVNLPELVRIWSTVADTVLTREAGGVSDKIPEMEGGKAEDIFMPQTRALRSVMKFVREQLEEYEKMSGKEKKENSHIPLVMYGIAKAAAIDARLVQSDAIDDPNSKTNEAVRQTLRTLEETKGYKGTVAIFADNYQNKASGFNLYEDIRKKLIGAGVPAEQVVVIKPGMTVRKKLEIFDKVNAGEVRVVLGSTATLGTGVNIQERLHTLIHLDAPNRPMDYTQRNGRILRQGNLHNDWGLPVRVLRFGVEDSLDVTAYQRLKTKGAIADSIMNGKQLMENSMENRMLEEEQDLFGDMTAQLSGSEYAMMKNQIEKEVRKLRAAEKNWMADQTYIHNRKRQLDGQNKEAEKRIADNKGYLDKVEAAEVNDITVGKQTYGSVEEMDEFFTEQNKKKKAMQEEVRTSYSGRASSDIAISVGGFDFNVHTEIGKETKQGAQGDLFYSAPAKMTYSCPELGIEEAPVSGNLIKNAMTEIMENIMSGKDFRERIDYAERALERNNEELRSMAAREGQPFKHSEELAKAQAKLEEYEELMKQEMAAKEAKYAEMDKDVEAAANVEYTEEENEDTANEPIAEYSGKSANFASRYETKDGKTINYASEDAEAYGGLFLYDNRRDRNDRPGANAVRREDNPLRSTLGDRLSAERGEFCHVERVFEEKGGFNFMAGERIESAADVAYIFSSLEDAAKEHSFVVLVKDGKPTVVELGMGTFSATMVDTQTALLAYSRIKPDEVYFVHNHPSGQLMRSPQDVLSLRNLSNAMPEVAVRGVIINLKTGKYGTFDIGYKYGTGQKRVPATSTPLSVYSLDKQIFAPDYDPEAQPKLSSPKQVAEFLNSHRMGDREKVSFLILNIGGRVVGNIHTPFKEISKDVDAKARYIGERVIQFGGAGAILYGDFKITKPAGAAYRALKERMMTLTETTLHDVVRVQGNNTSSYLDSGYALEPQSEYGPKDGGLRFREVDDEAVLKEFDEGKTVKAYRTMQVIDGKLYSPMATKAGGKATPEIKLGVAEQAEEHPEIINGTATSREGREHGYVTIDKGLGKGSLKVAYNPYVHTSRTALNDQFSSAYIRPNLVTVEVEVPQSELTSGYRAERAKDAVGEISWHSGSVSGQLAELGQPRRVILTRYDRPVRIVPYSEVAEMIARQLDGTNVSIPYNVVQPQVRVELERLGVAISEAATGKVGAEADYGRAEYITDQEIERINAMQQEMAQTSIEAKSRHAEKMAQRLNTPVRIVADVEELGAPGDKQLAERMRKSKGWYDTQTGEVVVVLPNHASVEDVAETVLHEVVAHKGLREMVGEENYDAFCDEVYGHLKDDLKEGVDQDATRRFMNDPARGHEAHRREAVDEMFGRLAEKGFEDFTKAERGIWAKLKAKVLEAINKFLGSLKLPKWVKLGDNELRYMLWRSHERLSSKGDYVDMARDVAKREELGLNGERRFRDGETDDIWRDGSLGMDEKIANAAIRLSNNQSGDLALRNNAQRAVVNSLQSLLRSMRSRGVKAGVRDAMNAQTKYDRVTVKRVKDLARVLMQTGYISDATSGEMQRLLSAVGNATGASDIADSVENIMDVMIGNQLRNAKATLDKLLAIRGSKVDARGIEVQGALDVDGQRTMEVVKKAMRLTEDEITDRIDEAINRMGDTDQTIADNAALEYAGLQLALEYVQNIGNSKADETALRDMLKTAKEEKDAGRMTADAYKQQVEAINEAIRKNKIERVEAYSDLVERLSGTVRDSIDKAKAFREAEKARIKEIQHNANSDMEGRPSNEHHKDNRIDKIMNNGAVQFVFAPLATFDQVLRVFGNKSANGEGYLWNRFMRGWIDCREKELVGFKKKLARLNAKAEELFGKGKTWGDLIRMESHLPKATVSFMDGGEMREHELTQGNLLYIYMVDKMTDGRMKLRAMGITEADVARIESVLDPRFKALGDWLQDEFLVETRNEYNETHKRMFGASMAAIENYFPLKILSNARVDKEDDVNQQGQPNGITTKTGSIIKRRVNKLALDITGADALSVILNHLTDMEHWNAYAEWNRDLNTLRTYKRFRNQVMNMTTVYGGGRELWKKFNDLCLMAAGEYRPPVAKLDKAAVNIAKGVTAAKVSFRIYTALKQFLSVPAYAPEVSLVSIAKSIANPYGDFKWCLENLPIFEERWHSRIAGDPRLLRSELDWKGWRNRVVEIAGRVGMTPNAFVDAVTVSIGAKAIYETRLKQYLKEGYSADAAEKRAKQDATILFNQTQQSSEAPFLSTMQVDSSWLSVMFTVFRNSSMSYTRQEFDAMRNLTRNLLKPGEKEKSIAFMAKQILRDWEIDPDAATDAERAKAENAAKSRFSRQIRKDLLRVATFGFVLQLFWNLGPYLPYLIFGKDEDEKDKMWDDAVSHAYFGSVEGLTGGDVMSAFGNMAVSGEWNWNQLGKDMPIACDIGSITNKYVKGKDAEALNDIVNLVAQMGVGVNPQSLTDPVLAIVDASGGDMELGREATLFAMRVMQVPQSQIDKIYFDEIDLSAEEASKLDIEELVKRYAKYKVMRGTTVTPWNWDDEELLGKYEKTATTRVKERLMKGEDQEVVAAYNEFEDRYKAVSKKERAYRKALTEDYVNAAAAWTEYSEDPDAWLVMDPTFKHCRSTLSEMSEALLGSKTAAEAQEHNETLRAYRAAVVKYLQAETDEAKDEALREAWDIESAYLEGKHKANQ